MTKQNNHALKTYLRLVSYIKPYWLMLGIGIMAIIVAAVVDAGFVWGLQPLLDQGFIARDQWIIRWIPVIVMMAFLLRGLANFSSNFFFTWVARRVIMQIRQQLFAQLLKLPATYYDQRSPGELLAVIIYNVEQVAEASTKVLIGLLREGGLMIALFFVMWINSWELTLLFAISAPLLAMITRYTSRRLRHLGHQVQRAVGNVTQVAEEAVRGYKVIRTFGSQRYEQAKFNHEVQYNFNREMKMVVTHGLAIPLVQLIVGLVIATTIYLATSEILQLSAGAFTSMVTAMIALLKPLKALSSLNITLQKGIAAAESIFALLDEKAEQDTGQIILQRARGDIEFQRVSFAYPNSRTILHDISFKVKAGQTIALVGRSGSGKSTLVNLLQHFYDNYQGVITVDGQDIRQLTLASLRQQFSVVSQNVTLFNDTVANNIAYGVLEQTNRQAIEQAAQAAHAMEFIVNLPQGFDTVIGESGLRLSGGQRQRIAIARALLKDSPILILDEATSALDTEAERHIQLALDTLKRNRTTLVIAHRLSTVEKADAILVLERGKIIESGTHHELLQKQGVYTKLYTTQFKDEHITTD